MIEKIDHIGIAVENLEKAIENYKELYGLGPAKIETMDAINVKIAFIPIGDVLIELLQPTKPGTGRIGRYLKEKGEGFHHIAFRVKNIDQMLEKLKSQGVPLRDNEPREGGHNSRVAFIEPGATQSLLTEVVERKEELEKDYDEYSRTT